jgi:predicted O-methyltransferase YrrM
VAPRSPAPDDLALWGEVDRYFGQLLGDTDELLEAALAASRDANLPPIQVSPLQGKFLHILARACGARRILEVGTLGGYSTIWLARALPSDGRLLSLELDPRHAQVARSNLARAGLADRVEVRVGPASTGLAELLRADGPPFDFVFLDADKPGYPDYLDAAIRLAHPGSLIVADNVVRGGEVVDGSSPDPNVQGVRRMTERLARDRRVRATVLQTVGEKGHDGIAVAVVL